MGRTGTRYKYGMNTARIAATRAVPRMGKDGTRLDGINTNRIATPYVHFNTARLNVAREAQVEMKYDVRLISIRE